MPIAYIDGVAGIAGDMFVGALLDAGAPFEALCAEITKLQIDGIDIHAEPVVKKGISATNFTVTKTSDHSHRSLSRIREIITASALSDGVKQRSLAVFQRIGEAEADVHAKDVEKIHFHEVGAWDSIVDIVGAAIALELLGIDRLFFAPLNLGSGQVKAAHGVMPVPAPATALLARGLPTYANGPAKELTTPTGAGIAATLAAGFGPMPAMTITALGYGAGDRDLDDRANVVRVVLGEPTTAPEATLIHVIEANLDDMTPEAAGYALERLLDEGALDVTLAPLQMKKNRPGFQLAVLAKPQDSERLTQALFAETTTLGVRTYSAERRILEREIVEVGTPYGRVRVKAAKNSGQIRNAAPEYDDCRRLASEQEIPLRQVQEAALRAFWDKETPNG